MRDKLICFFSNYMLDYKDILAPYLVIDLLFGEEFIFKPNETMKIDLFGEKVSVVTIDKLIELKKNAGRPKDLEDVHELEEIKIKK